MSCRSACSLSSWRLCAALASPKTNPRNTPENNEDTCENPRITPTFRQACRPVGKLAQVEALRLGKERLLGVGRFHGQRALRAVIRHVVDPRAHREAPHE